ncbi:hypothetical protein ABZ249_25330 [Nocardiopsis sp. NPDC006139]|uniref:hypothetical protein n=1 Tax=Nocardiopsis sp. NPDC006139 TaxID=3154578 RepID=UPI0033B7D0F6
MATVYRNAERAAAHEAHPGTIAHAERLEAIASQVLAARREEGDSYTEVTRGRRADAFVALVDPGPDGNALAIEMGRSPGAEHGATQGVYALHAAMGARGG